MGKVSQHVMSIFIIYNLNFNKQVIMNIKVMNKIYYTVKKHKKLHNYKIIL